MNTFWLKTITCRFLGIVCLMLIVGKRKTVTGSVLNLSDVAPPDYDHLTPPKADGNAVEVGMYLKVLNIRSVDESDQTFSAVIELWQMWTDNRLLFPSWSIQEYQLLDSQWRGRLWNPNLYFVNSVDGKLDNIITPSSFFWLNREKHIFFCCRVSLHLSCEMNLKDFPHDEQQCGIKVASAIFDETNVKLKWRPLFQSTAAKSIGLPQFLLGEITIDECLAPIGRFNASCLEVSISLKRRSGYFVINVYIPTILIVAMSMLTFWIPPDAVPARVTLGVTSLLTIITKQYQASLPNVSYIVALNVWLSCCIGFVFCSLLEYATVIAMATREKKAEFANAGQDFILPMVQLRVNGTWTVKKAWSGKKKRFTPKLVDYISRIVFPVSFVIFCIIYWSKYD